MKKYFTSMLSLIVISLVVSNTLFLSKAAPDACGVKNATFEISLKNTSLDVTRTVNDIAGAGMFSAFAGIYGTDTDTFAGCGAYLNSKVAGMEESLAAECDGTDEFVCDEMVGNWSDDGKVVLKNGSLADARIRGIRGSLLGLSNLVEGVVVNEPLPVNFAYYWNQSISKLPVANKALAAPVNDSYANMPVIMGVYDVWVVSRNISLALMAIVLLYTGIMIIMRKKVNPQLIVSVQYAIPKIIIGVFLILFSYIIGAAITYVGWGLFRGANSMVWSSFPSLGNVTVSGSTVIAIIVVGLLVLVSSAGGVFLLLLLGLGLITLVLSIVLWLKAFLVYLKMAFSIITAPIEFVLGTIPGSEARLTDWFKRMGKYLVTLFAIGLVIPLTLAVALSVATAFFGGSGRSELGGMGVLLGLISPLIIIIVGYSMGLGIDKKVDEMFFGVKKK